jgi:hypothetical protein
MVREKLRDCAAFVRGRLGVLCGDCNLADGRKHAAVYRAKKTESVPF